MSTDTPRPGGDDEPTEEFDQPGPGDPDYLDDAELQSLTATEAVGLETVGLVATREPSDLARRYLFPTEKFRGEWRRHWVALARHMSIGVVATLVLGYVAGYFASRQMAAALTVLVVLWLVVIGWVLWEVAEWYYDRFILTNKRVMLIEGIISRNVAMMPLARVTDMKYTQTPMGRVLGYGKFELESAGQEQALRNVPYLPNPTDLYLQVVEEMYEPDASEARRRPAQIDDGS